MRLDPKRIAIEYYFGDLQYWKIPLIATNALEEGYDGPALRKLAGLSSRSRGEVRADDVGEDEIDSAFRELGVDAPITRENARMALAIESANRALNGASNVFDEATHIRIHLCELSNPPEALMPIVNLSNEAKTAPSSQWGVIEQALQNAFTVLLSGKGIQSPA
jgi:hypothetical protein